MDEAERLSDAATTRLGPPDASWPVQAGGSRAVLQLRLGHWDNLEVHPLARADSLEECRWGWLFYRRVKTGKTFYRPMNRVVRAHVQSILPNGSTPGEPVFMGGG